MILTKYNYLEVAGIDTHMSIKSLSSQYYWLWSSYDVDHGMTDGSSLSTVCKAVLGSYDGGLPFSPMLNGSQVSPPGADLVAASLLIGDAPGG
ncbi:hypothetical protein L2E82_12901 [Cichorium intybus]|uniref:Uncharacterized protein n=1 Tax=Cichorium intybus TaxID=13427 RepID=A0ACB9GH53_CICIN|nr:hypothetical protein L2E82_12901 [Cichorium intybus]